MAMIWLNHAGENRIVVIAGANAALDTAHVEREQARIADAGILLLQLDSDINENDRYTGKLMWGDSGVANFFITPEDLAKRDFNRTAFMFDYH